MRIFDVLTGDEAAAVRDRVAALTFRDGAASASGAARAAKHNSQADGADEATRELVDEITTRLSDHHGFLDAAFPRHFARVGVNRYGPGDRYGLHLDVATMGPVGRSRRTDLSFTLFLSDPDSYEGGELRIVNGGSSSSVKLRAGQLVLYPTGLMHEVTPIRSGERVSIIGWVESWIADPVIREIAAKLHSFESVVKDALDPMAALQLAEIKAELIRFGAR